jgi:hypothetical protein
VPSSTQRLIEDSLTPIALANCRVVRVPDVSVSPLSEWTF